MHFEKRYSGEHNLQHVKRVSLYTTDITYTYMYGFPKDARNIIICQDLENMATKMVETEKNELFPSFYKLIEVALILSV
jgi:hypothetical protein